MTLIEIILFVFSFFFAFLLAQYYFKDFGVIKWIIAILLGFLLFGFCACIKFWRIVNQIKKQQQKTKNAKAEKVE